MPTAPVEVKKALPTPTPARAAMPDVFQSFRNEIDWLFRPLLERLRLPLDAPRRRYLSASAAWRDEIIG